MENELIKKGTKIEVLDDSKKKNVRIVISDKESNALGIEGWASKRVVDNDTLIADVFVDVTANENGMFTSFVTMLPTISKASELRIKHTIAKMNSTATAEEAGVG